MPTSSSGPASDHARARGRRGLPLWARWALAVVFFGGPATAGVIAIERGRSPEPSGRAAIEDDLEARGVIARDQAPHTTPLGRAASPRRALERAVLADVRRRIERGQLTGRAQRVRCRPAKPARPSRRPLRCTALAGAIRYPFLGVVDLRARRLTWCKRDPPAVAGSALDVPVSRHCRT